MNFVCEKDKWRECFTFSGRVSAHDFLRLRLDAGDRLLLTDPPKTAADVLLILEMLVRRYLEQNPDVVTWVEDGPFVVRTELRRKSPAPEGSS